jgi:fatty-acyl-CoA synthase
MRLTERLRSDILYLRAFARALRQVRPIDKTPARVFPALVDGLAARHGDRPALLSERETFSYRDLAGRTNRYARWTLAQDLAKGETVCLLMPNRPEYVAIWLGVTRVGGVAALLNTNLAGERLAACIESVAAKHVIVAAELAPQIAGAEPHLKNKPRLWIKGEGASRYPRIDIDIEGLSAAPLDGDEIRGVTLADRALYIFTAGMTGLPKPAIIDHQRLMVAIAGFAGLIGARRNDRMYDCLPLYHMLGGVLAIGPLLLRGGSVVIRNEFSPHDFWRDIRRTDCTLLQYAGDIPAALLRIPPQPEEDRHRLRLCCGAGLHPDLWREFKTRFRIPRILEFYGTTEGNVALFNIEGKEGSVGRIPWFVWRRFPTTLIRFNVEKELALRDSRGFCMRCGPGEPGELIGAISLGKGRLVGRFAGYFDKADNEGKILRNVFAPGDAWFRTGDLMTQDADGYFYFIDRIGDTFRWKGENVSTTEVARALRSFPGVEGAIVYGVRVPDREGRAGAATLVCPGWIDVSALHDHLAKRLPGYARPLFVRVHRAGTEAARKLKKADLAEDGFDPTRTSDQLYFNDTQKKSFVPIDAGLYARIMEGEARL